MLAIAISPPDSIPQLTNFLTGRELKRPLGDLNSLLGLVRRFLRTFRFFDSFTDSYNVFLSMSTPAGSKQADSSQFLLKTLDGLAGTFNGLYLFLETLGLVDALGIPELAVLGPELERALKIESQRCWFFALAAGALACFLRLQQMQASAAPGDPKSEKQGKEGEKRRAAEKEAQDSKIAKQRWRLKRKMVASLLDLALPGSVVGWIPVSMGTVGSVTLVTSVMTGLDVWERCGKEVGRI